MILGRILRLVSKRRCKKKVVPLRDLLKEGESYATQEEFISDWIEHFRRNIRKKSRKGIRSMEKRIWNKMGNTRADERFPFFKFVRQHRLSKDEIKVILYLAYLTIENPNIYHPFEERNLLQMLERIHPHSKKRIERAYSIVKRGKLFKHKILVPGERYDEYFQTPPILTPIGLSSTTWSILLPKTDWSIPKKKRRRLKKLRHFYMVNPSKGLSSVVLSPENREKIRMAISQLKNSKLFYKKWGFDRVLEKGKGMVMLFYGPPGTGKTLTAEAIAKELKKELYIINVAGILSMWVGETEKNITSAFKIAQKEDPVLLFDEADSLLQTRASNPNFNYHNREVNTLLQQIEEYEGLLILITNMWGLLDSALERRIAIKLKFDKPDKEMRKRIWRKLIPKNLPLNPDVDIDLLAERFELTGGEIKNVILNAARRALVRRKRTVGLRDFIEAAENEKIKEDKSLKVGF